MMNTQQTAFQLIVASSSVQYYNIITHTHTPSALLL